MITVRFPNGQAVRYNSAQFAVWDAAGGVSLFTQKEDGRFVARVLAGSGAIVEFVSPCEISNPVADREAAMKILLRDIRQVKDLSALAELKRSLNSFNAKSHTWRKAEDLNLLTD